MVDRARWTSKVALLVLAIVSTAHAASWTSTGHTVHVIDWQHYALRVASGKVMLVDMQGIVELYNPETRTFSLGSPVPPPLERQVPGERCSVTVASWSQVGRRVFILLHVRTWRTPRRGAGPRRRSARARRGCDRRGELCDIGVARRNFHLPKVGRDHALG